MHIVVGIFFGLLGIGMIIEILGLFGVHVTTWPLITLVVGVIVIVKGKTIASTLDYLFTKYRAAPMATSADTSGLAPTFHLEHRAQAERAMKDKFDAEAEIADATIRRERARAALEDAEREVEETRRRSIERS